MSRFIALLSLLLFALSLLSALKLRALARLAGGLAQQYRAHHWIGAATALALIAHVLWELLQVPRSLMQSMVLSSDPALIAAWLAFLLFFAAFLLSYQRRLKFRHWHRWHLLFPLAFIVSAFHVWAFARPESLDRLVIILAFAGGLGSILVTALARYWSPVSQAFSLRALNRLSASVWELLLEPEDKTKAARACLAGDIVYLRFNAPGFSRGLHPFTVASCCTEPFLRLYVKSLGRDTSHLEDLQQGSTVSVFGPFRELALDRQREQIWLAGGVGLAPFLGFLHCLQGQLTPPIHLVHFISRAEECLPAREVENLLRTLPQVIWQNALDEPPTRAQFDRLDSLLQTAHHPLIIICGPNPFMRMARRYLRRRGVPSANIITEEFMP